MRVPEARSTARVGTLNTVMASPDAFGAGIGRAMEGVGREVSKLGEKGMDVAAEMKRKQVIRDAEDAFSNASMQGEEWYQSDVASKKGRDTDLFDGPEKFQKNITSKLDDIYTKTADGLSDNAKQRFGVMWQNQRMALEKRAANHFFTQQEDAAKYASKRAVDAAAANYALQAQQYTKKQPDGTVSIDWKELDRMIPDVVSAQSIYNKRHGIPDEIDLPDGTKQNTLVKDARAGAHAKAIEAMLSANEYDEADAYLKSVTDSSVYKNDLDPKQIAVSKEAIQQGRERLQKRNESVETDRLYKDWMNGSTPLNAPAKEIISKYPGLSDSMKVKMLASDAKQKPVMDEKLIAGGFADIAATDATPANGILLARRLEEQGFKKETDTAIWNAFDEKFNPQKAGSVSGKYSGQFAIEKAQLVDTLTKANDGWLWTHPVSMKGDKLSDFNALVARETDGMDNFVSERVKKGVPYEQAISDYWKQPRIAELKKTKNIKAFIENRVKAPDPQQEKKSDAGAAVLRGMVPAQSAYFNLSDEQFNAFGLGK